MPPAHLQEPRSYKKQKDCSQRGGGLGLMLDARREMIGEMLMVYLMPENCSQDKFAHEFAEALLVVMISGQ